MAINEIDAPTLKAWLSDGGEIALIDVREAGQFGEAHPFFAVPLPYSRFELGLPDLVPNPDVRLVLTDGGDGVAARAARRAEALGYKNLHVLEGGAEGWSRAGYMLYAGVNVPSKTFGELVEHRRQTPRLTAAELQAMREAGENMVIVDGRPFAEYHKMNIPDGICCPNGELALRIRDIAPDPRTKIVVNCAGRTRSIIGAQTLIDFGVPNPVFALENGTQGWFLAGLQVERGASRRHLVSPPQNMRGLAANARSLADQHGVVWVAPEVAHGWLADPSRTTYLLDVRTPEEFYATGVPGFVHAPGGQLIQATDQWVGVRGARLVLLDDEHVRAPVVATWLRQLGHEAYVLNADIAATAALAWRRPAPSSPPSLPTITPAKAAAALSAGTARIIDLRPGMTFRKGHIAGATWSIRPRIAALADPDKIQVLVADEPEHAALAARDLAEAGAKDVRLLAGGYGAWHAERLPVAQTPKTPADADCIDFLFFTSGRHDGDAAAARHYLTWEQGLITQLDAQERGVFFPSDQDG
ncbi:MAG TPA: rhodanese-like domain-containing protein [Xanthobacteraceae bacterium]|nr:rhodanese-like domain-containing protein [Xanthobacteraceae bacterium]